MRIVQIVENLRVGGLERIAADLAIAQRQTGHDSSIYCVFERGDLAAEAERAGVVIHAFHKRRGFCPKTLLRLAWQLRRDRADVVHTHGSAIHHYGVLAGKMAGARAIVNTRHGTGVMHSGRKQEERYRKTMPWTDAAVFVCSDGLRFFTAQRGVPRDKAHVILNGIPLDRFRAISASPGSRLPVLRFAAVGRFVPAKAHDVLLDAFARVRSHLPGAILSIMGYGELRSAVEAQIQRLGLEGSVRIEGKDYDLVRFLAGADIFVLSSVSEGLPVVILEAMAAGLPVVSTRVGGVPEVVPEASGWFCEPGDAGALADAMLAAAQSGRLDVAGHIAREAAFAHFGVETMQREYERLFLRLLNP